MLPEHSRARVLRTANCSPVNRADIISLQALKPLADFYWHGLVEQLSLDKFFTDDSCPGNHGMELAHGHVPRAPTETAVRVHIHFVCVSIL